MTKEIVINDNKYPVFCTVEEANSYFATKLDASKWTALKNEDKAKVLIEATRKLNTLKYGGFKVSNTQPLEFPRYYKPNFLSKRTYTSEANAISVNGKTLFILNCLKKWFLRVVNKQCILRNIQAFIRSICSHKNQRLGITSINIGGGTVSYGGSLPLQICPEATQYIEKYLIRTARVV